jgi:hypothetical protein
MKFLISEYETQFDIIFFVFRERDPRTDKFDFPENIPVSI